MDINIIESSYRLFNKYSQKSKKPKHYGTDDLLYPSEVHMLDVIGSHDDLNTTRLAQILGITKGAVSQTIGKLTTKGIVETQTAQKRNEIRIALTEKGRTVFDFHRNMHSEMHAQLHDVLSQLPPEALCAVGRIIGIIDESLDRV